MGGGTCSYLSLQMSPGQPGLLRLIDSSTAVTSSIQVLVASVKMGFLYNSELV